MRLVIQVLVETCIIKGIQADSHGSNTVKVKLGLENLFFNFSMICIRCRKSYFRHEAILWNMIMTTVDVRSLLIDSTDGARQRIMIIGENAPLFHWFSLNGSNNRAYERGNYHI